jgi:hypothetical protein
MTKLTEAYNAETGYTAYRMTTESFRFTVRPATDGFEMIVSDKGGRFISQYNHIPSLKVAQTLADKMAWIDRTPRS